MISTWASFSEENDESGRNLRLRPSIHGKIERRALTFWNAFHPLDRTSREASTMASAAQIAANIKNSARSTGPTSPEGKQRVRLNALKHGMNARTVVPFSLREDPVLLEERTREWESDLCPRNAMEGNLVRQAARLSLAIERGELIEAQMLAEWRVRQVREQGRRLLYIAAPEEVKVPRMATWADDPETLLRHLEESPEGCRWLLERWGEFRNLLDCKTKWETPVMRRFIRLQGKYFLESVYDPALNAIFLAWDLLCPGYAKKLRGYRIDSPCTDPAINDRLRWREITDRPTDREAAWASLYSIVDDHVGRLKEVLAAHEAMGITGDPDWVDRAALEGSPAFEKLRRKQSALHRELMQTLDALRKMRNVAFGTENEDGKGGKRRMMQGESRTDTDQCQMPEDRCQISRHEFQMAEHKGRIDLDRCQMAEDKCQISRHEFQMAEHKGRIDPDRCQMPEDRCQISRHEFQMAEHKGRIDPDRCQMPEDRCQISRHEFQMAEDKGQRSDDWCQGADEEIQNGAPDAGVEDAEKSLPESVTKARKLQNKANSDFGDLKQETQWQDLRSEAAETRATKQSQFPGGCR